MHYFIYPCIYQSHYECSGLPVNHSGSITELNKVWLNAKHARLTSVSQPVFLSRTLFSENLLIYAKCAVVQPALYNNMLPATFCNTEKIQWDVSLAHYGGDEIPLIDTN
jgi:hypothetical protein